MTPDQLFAVMEATWPAAFVHRAGPWLVREGQDGGQRVSATTAAADWLPDDIPLAEAGMAALNQTALFMVRNGETLLDAELFKLGYSIKDPVVGYVAPCTLLADPTPDAMTAFPHWPPLSIAADLWAEGGIGPRRMAVMDRVKGARTAILGRVHDRAAGIAFVACAGDRAMLHALEVTPTQRRQGVGHNILRAAAIWAQDQGARDLSLAVTAGNTEARKLYTSLGMEVVGTYHYRIKISVLPTR